MKIFVFLTLLCSGAFAGDNDRSLIAYQVKSNIFGLDFGGSSYSASTDIMYSTDPSVPAGIAGSRLGGLTISGNSIFFSGSYGFSDQVALEISTSSRTYTTTFGATPTVTKYSGLGDVVTSLKLRLDNGSLFARVSAGLGVSPGKQIFTTNSSDPNETDVNNYSGGFSAPLNLYFGVTGDGFNWGAHLGYLYRGTRTITPATGAGDTTTTGGSATYTGLFAEYVSEVWGIGIAADSIDTAVAANTDSAGTITNTAGSSLLAYSLQASVSPTPSFAVLVGATIIPSTMKFNTPLLVDPKYNLTTTNLTLRFMF